MISRPLLAVVFAASFVSASAQQAQQLATWRSEIRHALDIPDTLPALDAHTWSSFSPMPGVLADRVTYNTADGMIVPAVVYRPDPKLLKPHQKLPGIVIVNGHGGDKFSWYAFYSGLLFANAGAVVVTYDPIGEGERDAHRLSRQSPSPHDAPVPDAQAHHLAGLMQVDLAQAVSYLAAQPQVDPRRIATVGYSMGAFVAGIEGAWDTRPHAVVVSGGGTYDGPGEYFDSGKLPCQAPPYRALAPLGDRGPVLATLNAARGPMYVMNGLNDEVMRIDVHNPAWFEGVRARSLALGANPATLFTTVFYPGISHRTSWVNTDGVRWLNQQLHFAFWNSDAKVAAAGITHISTWIKANNVDISKNYLVETREGGLDAVGTGFPGIPRADLMVLPEADWQRLTPQLTYENWASKTKENLPMQTKSPAPDTPASAHVN